MSNKPLYLLILVLLLAGVGGAIWFGKPAHDSSAPVAFEPQAANRTDQPHELSAVGSELAEPGERQAVTRVAGADLDPDEIEWIHGRVVFPPGTPPDEQVAIFATTSRFLDFEDLDDLQELFDNPRTVRAEVLGDGSFSIPFTKEHRQATLILRGRYLYSPEASARVPADGVVIEPELGARLTGRLKAPSQAGAEVGIGDLTASRVHLVPQVSVGWADGYHVSVDEDRRFTFAGIDVKGTAALLLENPIFSPSIQSGIELTAGVTTHVSFQVQLGGRIDGRVVDEEGAGIEGASVAHAPDFMDVTAGEPHEVESGPDGAFSLSGLPTGEVVLFAHADDRVGVKEKFDFADGQVIREHVFRLTNGDTVGGRVVWPDGEGVPRADVMLYGTLVQEGQAFDPPIEHRGVETDEDGAFEFRGLAQGTYRLSAVAQRDGLAWRASEASATGGGNNVLILSAPVGVSGRVVDDIGDPVEEFELDWTPSDPDESGMADGDHNQFNDKNGEFFEKNIPAGEWVLSVYAEGYDATEDQTVRLPGDGAPLLFVMRRRARVSGTVTDPMGMPVKDASVMFVSDDYEIENVSSEKGGRFQSEDVPSGNVSATAHATAYTDEWAASPLLELILSPGQVIEDLELVLQIGGRLTGDVYDSGGAPAPDQMISLNGVGFEHYSEDQVVTDTRGLFEAGPLAPGEYQVTSMPNYAAVEHDDTVDLMSRVKMSKATIVEGQTTHVVLGAPPANPIRLFGCVKRGGEPVAEAALMVLAEGREMMSGWKMGRADEAGNYELTLDSPGDYVIGVSLGDLSDLSSEFFVRVPEGTEYRRDIELPLGGISGRVLWPDGSPVKGATVTLSSNGTSSLFALEGGMARAAGEDGRYEFAGVSPATYTVRAGHVAMYDGREGTAISIRTDVVVAEGRTTTGIDFELELGGKITGNVRDQAGLPVAGASIFFRNAVTGQFLSLVCECVTDSTGHFSYDSAPAGPVSAFARKDGLRSTESGAVQVSLDEAAEVTLVIEPGTVLVITVVDEEQGPRRCRLQVIDGAGRECSGVISEEDRDHIVNNGFSTTVRRVGPLPPGTYEVKATDEAGRSASKSARLEGQPERSLEIRLE